MDNGSQAKENTVVVFGGTGFLGRASFGTSAPMRFLFGLHRGTPTGVTSYLAVTIRTFNRSALTSTTSGQWPTHLLALTVW